MHKIVDGKKIEFSPKEEKEIKEKWEKNTKEKKERKQKEENIKTTKKNKILSNIKYLKSKGWDNRMILILYDDARKLEGYVEDPTDDINPKVKRRGKGGKK